MLKRLLLLLLFVPLFAIAAQPRVIHVLVSLCDNAHQGIVPVPAKISNGQDPKNNLYWGAMYGLKTFMSKQTDFRRVDFKADSNKPELDRVVFQHIPTGTIVVADAHDGAYMRHTINAFFNYAAGKNKVTIESGGKTYTAGGGADLIVFVGHNGLMDFSQGSVPAPVDGKKREVAVFACKSRDYFLGLLKKTGATPLLFTTGFMAPEGYVFHALAAAWAEGKPRSEIRERVARAYDKYQKCGLNGARRLFATE